MNDKNVIRIQIGNPIVVFLGVLYFIISGLSPIWAVILIGPDKIAWENLWIGPAGALAVLLFCYLLDDKRE